MKKAKQSWKLYILQCADGTLYTGITTNLERRIAQHSAGKGAKYTRSRAPLKLVYEQNFKSQSAALAREAQIKKLSRVQKLQLISDAVANDAVVT